MAFESTLAQRSKHFTVAEWIIIVGAYVRADDADVLLTRCRETFEKNYGCEIWECGHGAKDSFLPAAALALGEPLYRSLLLPFVTQMHVFAAKASHRASFPCAADEFQALVRDFEDWCQSAKIHERHKHHKYHSFDRLTDLLQDWVNNEVERLVAAGKDFWECAPATASAGLTNGDDTRLRECLWALQFVMEDNVQLWAAARDGGDA